MKPENHPHYQDFNGTEMSTQISQTLAMWAIAAELREMNKKMREQK